MERFKYFSRARIVEMECWREKGEKNEKEK